MFVVGLALEEPAAGRRGRGAVLALELELRELTKRRQVLPDQVLTAFGDPLGVQVG